MFCEKIAEDGTYEEKPTWVKVAKNQGQLDRFSDLRLTLKS